MEEETGRKFQLCSLYSSHRVTGSHLQVWRCTTQTLSLIFPIWAVHTSRITEIPQYYDIFQELDYFRVFLLIGVCKVQVSQYCLVLMVQLPPFLKSMQPIHWVVILIKSKDTFQMGISVCLFRNFLLGIVEQHSHTW